MTTINSSTFIYFIHQLIGLAVTAMSFTLKVPQIYTILQKKSVKGLSPLSNYFDFYSILFQGLYAQHKNLSYLVYLENYITTVQNISIIFLSWYYSDKKAEYKDYLLRGLFCLTTPLLLVVTTIDQGNYIPELIWTIMVFLGIPFMSLSRIDQMRKIYTEKSVGSVSLMSFIFRAVKNYSKVIVIAAEKFNWSLIINQAWYGILTTGVIIFYFIYNKPKGTKKVS